MTENELQESCATKAKSYWSNCYDSPCFWLKTIPLLIVIGLASIGLYQIVTSALHYFSEPLSYFDPERLGQLGDFLGGTLNPIFGFATICLLLWSVFIQRKELFLTRKELKKTAKALKRQNNLNKREQTRRQLEEVIERKITACEKNFNEPIFMDHNRSLNFLIKHKQENEYEYLNTYTSSIQQNSEYEPFRIKIGIIHEQLLEIVPYINKLIENKKYIHEKSIKEYWILYAVNYMKILTELNILSQTELTNYKSQFLSIDE